MHSVRRANSMLPAAGFLALCLAYCFWGWSDVLEDFDGDNAYYLLMAQSYSPWSSSSEVTSFFSRNQFPPLYPLLLAIFDGGESLLAAHLVTVTCLLLAFVALYAWLRALNIPTPAAGPLVLIFALMPGTYMQALSILSENLYLFLSLVCLASVVAYENDGRHRWLWLAAASLAAATLTRSAGISLLVSFLAYLVLQRPPRYWQLVLLAALPLAAWSLIGSNGSSGYLAFLAGKYAADPLPLLWRHITTETAVLWSGWIKNFTGSRAAVPLMGFLAILCLAGAFHRAYRRRLDGFYAVAYLAMILVWPFPAEAQRLLFVITPVLLAQGVMLLELAPRIRLRGRDVKAVHVLFLVVFLTVIPDLALTVSRFLKPLPPGLSDYRRVPDWYVLDLDAAYAYVASMHVVAQHMSSIRARVPRGECVYAIKPSVIGYFSQRISYLPPAMHLDKAAYDAYIERINCRYVYMMSFFSSSYPEAYYPLIRARESLRIISVAQTDGVSTGPPGLLAEWVRSR